MIKIIDFFKKKPKEKPKKQGVNSDKIIFRDNYSTLSPIYRGSSYTIQEETGTLFFDLVDFDAFWEKYISRHPRYLDKYDQSFVTLRIIDSGKTYIYPETLREKTKLDKDHLQPVGQSGYLYSFTDGLIEVGFWDFSTSSFDPVWSAKYVS